MDKISEISLILTLTDDNTIGNDNTYPWNFPTNTNKINSLIENGTVIIGRKYWESLKETPKCERLIIITSNEALETNGVETSNNILNTLNEVVYESNGVFVIGGRSIFQETIDYADRLFLTKIMSPYSGNVKLDVIVESEWSLRAFEGPISEDSLTYRFDEYVRTNVMHTKKSRSNGETT